MTLHVLTLLYFPVHVVLLTAGFAIVLCLAIPTVLLPGRTVDRLFDAVPFRPSWWVTRGELLHEGDAEWYRARTERAVQDILRGKSRWGQEDGTYVLPVHTYRALSACEALQIAAAYGCWPAYRSDAVIPARRIILIRGLNDAFAA
ncbi:MULTISPECIES: hypothetical protein [Streptomyces]|uniref:hypothetical protein n=1 Tax=Streptomyces TaxID=1883 RepID=UPI000B9E044B|nr:hypothetical protein [Streptomyces kasugaensis]